VFEYCHTSGETPLVHSSLQKQNHVVTSLRLFAYGTSTTETGGGGARPHSSQSGGGLQSIAVLCPPGLRGERWFKASEGRGDGRPRVSGIPAALSPYCKATAVNLYSVTFECQRYLATFSVCNCYMNSCRLVMHSSLHFWTVRSVNGSGKKIPVRWTWCNQTPI